MSTVDSAQSFAPLDDELLASTPRRVAIMSDRLAELVVVLLADSRLASMQELPPLTAAFVARFLSGSASAHSA